MNRNINLYHVVHVDCILSFFLKSLALCAHFALVLVKSSLMYTSSQFFSVFRFFLFFSKPTLKLWPMNLAMIGLVFPEALGPTLWLRPRANSGMSAPTFLAKLSTISSVLSPIFSGIPWIRTPFLLPYISSPSNLSSNSCIFRSFSDTILFRDSISLLTASFSSSMTLGSFRASFKASD